MTKTFLPLLLLVAGLALTGCSSQQDAPAANRIPGAPSGAQPAAGAASGAAVTPIPAQNAAR